MLYLLATSYVDATTFAGPILGIPLGRQFEEVRAVVIPGELPASFEDDDVVKMTSLFEEDLAQKAPDALVLARLVARRNMAITPVYDVPRELTVEAIEEWLED